MDLSFLNLGQLDPQTSQYFELLFAMASQQQPCVSGQQAAQFFQLSGLPTEVLRQIWNLSSVYKQPFLSKLEFYLGLKYVSLAQAGQFGNPSGADAYGNLRQMHQLLGLPRFQGVQVPGAASAGSHNPFGEGPTAPAKPDFNPFGPSANAQAPAQDDWGDFEGVKSENRQKLIEDAFDEVLNPPAAQESRKESHPVLKEIDLGDIGLKKKIAAADYGYMNMQGFQSAPPLLGMQQNLQPAVLPGAAPAFPAIPAQPQVTAPQVAPVVDVSDPFAEAFGSGPAAATQNEPVAAEDDGFGDFGDFGAFEEPAGHTAAAQEEDDFGDFEAAEQKVVAEPEPAKPEQNAPAQAPKFSDPFAEIIHKTFNINFEAKLQNEAATEKQPTPAAPVDLGKAGGGDDFGDFQEVPTTTPASFVPSVTFPAPSKIPDDDPFASIDKEEANDDGFGDFGDFEAAPQKEEAATEEPEPFGDFGDFEQAPVEAAKVPAAPQMEDLLAAMTAVAPDTQPQAPKAAVAEEDDGFGDFGDFEAATAAEQAPVKEPAVKNQVEDDPFAEILGEYGIKDTQPGADEAAKAAEPIEVSQPEPPAAEAQIVETKAAPEDDGFGDFGDFGDFETAEAPTVAEASKPDPFEEDPFGDFQGETEPVAPTTEKKPELEKKETEDGGADWAAGLQDDPFAEAVRPSLVDPEAPVIQEVPNTETKTGDAAAEQEGAEDGFGEFGDFADFEEPPAEEPKEAVKEEEQEKSFGEFEEAVEVKPAAPKKPLTETDLLSGFMSEFGSSLQKKFAQPTLNRSTSQGDSSAHENKSSQEEPEQLESARLSTARGRKTFPYEPATYSLEEKSAECQRSILAFFQESESAAKNLTELKDKIEELLGKDSGEFFKNAEANLEEYRPYLKALKDGTVVPKMEEYIRSEKQKAETKKKMREHVEEEDFEEAAICKKQIKGLDARQQEIESQVKAAITAGAPDAEGSEEPGLTAKDVLQAALTWEQKHTQSVTLTEMLIQVYSAHNQQLNQPQLVNTLLLHLLIYLHVNRALLSPDKLHDSLDFLRLTKFIQGQLRKIEVVHQKISDNLEVTFDDEEIERQNAEMLTKLAEDARIKAMFKALAVFRAACGVLVGAARIKAAFTGSSKDRDKKQLEEQVEALIALKGEVEELVARFNEQHPLVQQMVEESAKDVPLPTIMPLVQDWPPKDESTSSVLDIDKLASELTARDQANVRKVLHLCYDKIIHWDDEGAKGSREECLWPIIDAEFKHRDSRSTLYAVKLGILGGSQPAKSSDVDVLDTIWKMDLQAARE